MKRHLRGFIAPAFLIATLLFPLMVAGGQGSKLQRRRALQQTSSSTAQQSSTGQTTDQGKLGRRRVGGGMSANTTVATQNQQGQRRGRRVNAAVTITCWVHQDTLPTAVMQAVKNNPVLSRSVKITGNKISPVKGYSFWRLSNGGILILGDTPTTVTTEVFPYEEQQIIKLIDGKARVVTYVCYCPGSLQQDPCQFAREASGTAINLLKCENASCCQVKCVYVDDNGTPREC